MTYVKVEYEDELAPHPNNIKGINVVGEDEYFDTVVSFDINDNERYYLLFAVHTEDDSFNHCPDCITIIDLYQNRKTAEINQERLVGHHKNQPRGDQYREHDILLLKDDGTEQNYHISSWGKVFNVLQEIVVEEVMVSKYRKSIEVR